MSAGDASTLRQVSLAATLGLDARVLLTTDDAATHAIYDRAIDEAHQWWEKRVEAEANRTAVAVITMLGQALKRR